LDGEALNIPLSTPITDVEAYPRIVESLDAARQQPDFTKRERNFGEMARAFRRELPATYLYPRVYPIVAHRKIRGFDHDGWMPPAWRWGFGGWSGCGWRKTYEQQRATKPSTDSPVLVSTGTHHLCSGTPERRLRAKSG
jgi:hypothetical protein